METTNCPMCGTDRVATEIVAPSYGNSEEFRICLCAECGLGYVNPRPGPDEIGRYYPPVYHGPPAVGGGWRMGLKRRLQYAVLQEYFGWPRRLPRAWSWPVGHLYRPFLGRAVHYIRDGRVLDVGAGNGEFLAWLRAMDEGWRAIGLEPSPNGCRLAREAQAGRP